MADIKIKQTKKRGYGMETVLEVTGTDYISEDLLKILLKGIQPEQKIETGSVDQIKVNRMPMKAIHTANMRKALHTYISPAELKKAIEEGRGPVVIAPFDEIDIVMDTGDQITAVCGYVDNKMARFVFKDCLDNAVMNEKLDNKTGYCKSFGRKHVLEGIYPHLPPEWKSIITPRKITEIVNGEKVEYADPLWLPSATDVFGQPEDGYWEDIDGSFQLEIFKRERDRVKECMGNETCLWWLRSVIATDTAYFCHVNTSGSAGSSDAYYSLGFAPGFDI